MKVRKYFIYLLVAIYLGFSPGIQLAHADVCVSDQDALDIITLLDASERELNAMGSCERLVKELYKEVEARDEKLASMTNQLIEAKQDVIKYKASARTWRKWTIYTSVGGAVLVVLQILPKLL